LLRHWPEREHLLAPQQQRLDDLAERLPRALSARLDRARGELGRAGGALRLGLLERKLDRARERLASFERLRKLVHPDAPLKRGFARVADRSGNTLVSAAAARSAGAVSLIFADDTVAATVDGKLERPAAKRHIPAKTDQKAREQPKLL
jgi:exodeoxyribonuclease VII large subunit